MRDMIATPTGWRAAYFNASSPAVTQIVSPAPTTVTLTSTPNPAAHNKAVTFSVSAASGALIPAGSVTLRVNGAAVASKSLVNGAATFSRTFAAGTYAVTVVYAGNINFAGGTSNTISQVVQ